MKKNKKAKKNSKKGPKKATKSLKTLKSGIQPLGDRILIKTISPEEAEKNTHFGIIIPETVSKEKPEQGIVIAVGRGKYDDGKLIVPEVKVGDRVVFSKYGYDEIKVDGQEYYILSENSVLAIIN